MRARNRILLCVGVILVISLVALCIFHATEKKTARVPVLMYHHLAEVCPEGQEGMTASTSSFRTQLEALKAQGYESITTRQLVDFVENGVSLPKKPILITFDDGYTSNLTLGAPILQELGFCATIFVIGINEGEEYYAHSGAVLDPPRFSFDEARPWVDAGVIDVQSHTYDFHQLESYGFSGRDGVLPLDGETWEDYEAIIRADDSAFRQRWEGHGLPELIALAYPFGFCTPQVDELLADCGYLVTFTVQEHVNTVTEGDSACLRMMGRFDMRDDLTPEQILERISTQ